MTASPSMSPSKPPFGPFSEPHSQALTATDMALPGGRRGKVRDVYPLPAGSPTGEARVLIIATDRLSAFDVVLPTPMPGKGRLLNRISTFWLRFIERAGLARTHVISTDVADIPESAFRAGGTTRAQLEGRVLIGRRCRVIPVECVVRGYLEGSGWKDYKASGAVCGVRLPPGLRQCDRLPEPIFTPSTKAEPPAHDEPVSFAQVEALIGPALAAELRDRSLAIYRAAAAHALERGIIIADTKFEFGLPESGGGPIVIDEALTPDSSRFWPADSYGPGRAQASFDKQFVREHLERLVAAGQWNKAAPGPRLPDEVVAATLAKYAEAVERLTG
jgi:phosphoribosylaminoimidazole-succinocarboxamide synthase